MDASARATAFERLDEYVMENRRLLLWVARQYTHLDPEDLLHTAFSKALGILSRAKTPDDLERHLAAMLHRQYWYTAMRNVSHDQHDKTKKELTTDESPDDGGTYHRLPGDPTADDTTDWITENGRHKALWNALLALTSPDRRFANATDQLRHPHLTAEQWRILQVLHTLTQQGHHVRGIQAEVARSMGLAPATVSQHMRTILTMLQMTRYVAGVLGPAETLRQEATVTAALRAYDDWIAPQQKPSVILFRDLARSVRTDANSGTRARLDLLPPLPPDQAAERAELVHGQEADCAGALGNCYPNCAARCAQHNPIPDRTTEF